MVATQDEIETWRKEGWNFRVKSVKGKKYITRRRKQKEKSLGPYSEELWSKLNQTPILSERDLEIIEAKKNIESFLHIYRGYEMSLTCAHIVDEYCYFWKYEELPNLLTTLNSLTGENWYKKIFSNSGKPFWVFLANHFYCRGCPGYTPIK